MLVDLLNELRDRGEIEQRECFIDATFASAKGGGAEIGKMRRDQGVKPDRIDVVTVGGAQ